MMKHAFSLTAAALALSTVGVADLHAAYVDGASPQATNTVAGPHVQSMSNLERASQRLREAIQVMAQQAPGPDRDNAVKAANKALVDAQEAMAEYGPPAPKTLPPRSVSSPANYSEAVTKLRTASDRLYDAVHGMAKAPAGHNRNDAIANVNRALLATQDAMAWAADTRFAQSPAVGGTSSYAAGSTGSSHSASH
jgi:hypothetical protein